MARSFKSTRPSNVDFKDIYQKVTDKVISDLERGVRPWSQPWANGNPDNGVCMPLRHNGIPYRGINVFMLWSEAMVRGYSHAIWMTYDKARALGGQVRKGEKGCLAIYANKGTKTETDDAGNEKTRAFSFAKGYTVFNVEQIDGLPQQYYAIDTRPLAAAERLAAVDTFVNNTAAVVREGGDKAFYMPSIDAIQMPPAGAFTSPDRHASTLLHELVHWTGHAKRCDRNLNGRFGSMSYAAEELIAEMGAAFLCAALGVNCEAREDHASYVANWLEVLKNDKRAVFTAATAAQKAADYLHGLQGTETTTEGATADDEALEAA